MQTLDRVVRTKCAKWSPTDASRICSQHFKADEFESPFITIPGTAFVSRAVLKKDAVPSIHSQKAEPSNVDNDISSADLRSTRQHHNVRKIEQTCTCHISLFLYLLHIAFIVTFSCHKYESFFKLAIRGLLKENVTKTIHETGFFLTRNSSF